MCAPCKLLLNSHAAIGKLNGFMAGVEELNKRNHDIPFETHKKAIEVICGFDKAMDEIMELVHKGPHVRFDRNSLPVEP